MPRLTVERPRDTGQDTGRDDGGENGIATITVENAGRRNSVTLEMWQQFGPALDALASDSSVKVVVVRGAGDDFSSGADIRDLEKIFGAESLEHPTDGGWVTEAENALSSFPKPTIAAIDGFCVGGGWEIAAACDIRLASDRATFGVTPARIGIVYPLSGIERLVSIAGPAVAKLLLMTGELIDAERAAGFGMVTHVFPAADLWMRVDGFACELASRSQLSTNAMKDLVNAIALHDPALGDRMAHWQQEVAASDDPAIGREAFLAREAPQFTWLADPGAPNPSA